MKLLNRVYRILVRVSILVCVICLPAAIAAAEYKAKRWLAPIDAAFFRSDKSLYYFFYKDSYTVYPKKKGREYLNFPLK